MASSGDFAPALATQAAQTKVSIAAGVTSLSVQHNTSLVGSEAILDLEDGTGITWTVTDDSANTRIKATPAAALSHSESALSADVTLTSTNTYFDGPSVSLAAGTWLLTGQATVFHNVSSTITAKLWDGTTAVASGENQGGAEGTIPLSAVVSPGTTTTYKISAASNVGVNDIIKAACSSNGAGNNASKLTAVRIG